ncbi:MAG: SPOR domain-containing protein [Pseudomonadota bacterium]
MVTGTDKDPATQGAERDEDGDGGLPWLQPAETDGGEGLMTTRNLAIGAVVFILLFAGLLWLVYRQVADGREERPVVAQGEAPLIAAPQTPYKVAPEEPGGADIPDQDKLVLEAANGQAMEPDAQLAPPPEQPVARPSGSFAQAEKTPPAPSPTARQAPAAVPLTPTPAGRFMLQLGAFSTDASAKRGWTQLSAQYDEVVGDLQPDIEVATVGGRTLYRLRAASLATREEAERRCAALKDKGAGCLVIAQ